MTNYMRSLAGAALLAITIAGCGGGKTTTTTTTTASTAPMSEAQREQNALPQGTAAAVPAGMNCGAVQPVWVNMHTKAYHEPGDPYYGRTKNGQYMCPSAAAAAGYHAAGSHKHAMNSSESNEYASPGPGKHHRKHKSTY